MTKPDEQWTREEMARETADIHRETFEQAARLDAYGDPDLSRIARDLEATTEAALRGLHEGGTTCSPQK
jgi:hypothetical protein